MIMFISWSNLIIYTPFEISRSILTLFVVFEFDQKYNCKKYSKNMGNERNVPLFRDVCVF